ncbi:7TM diverse intracellular signaling domain-containing protein [Pseudochryseolinea flava]|uniref:Receptor n=1 Tax=Pseudochryseolinea flava TaxID=2059302 RepID=A0A364XZF0_9BACT|nr:7TM diverse intracellular signaling domain-containing protein [Pseudochryseolinea flava]RAV98992.1 receptor [Pseudochryseolinea flava]
MRSRRRTSVLAICLFFFFHASFAQEVIAIDDNLDQYIFTVDDLAYIEDADGSFKFEDVLGQYARHQFKPNQLYAPHNSNLKSTYWVCIKVQGNPKSKKKWLLEIFDQTIDEVDAYVPLATGAYQQIEMGDARPFDQRRFMHKNFEIEISHSDTVVRNYFFRFQSKSRVNFIVVLRSYDRFIYYALNEYFVYGLFYGMILVVAIYNLLMFFAIRERSYIVYIVYVLSVGIFTMTADGIAFQYLWPEFPQWNDTAHAIALFLLVLSGLVFTKMFLHTRARHPKLDLLLNAIIVVRSIVFVLAITFLPALFEFRWIEFIPVAAAFYCGLYSYLKGNKSARFFALAYGLLFLAFCVKVLINLDIDFIAGSIVTHYSISIGFWFEMWLLSFALGDKVRIIKDSKDRALRRIIKQHEVNQLLKDKVNRELEHEVSKRTKEISDQKLIIEMANEKLREQADEITKMNALLDLDNYKLKRTIHDEMLARAGSKNMDYDKFKEIFPEELTCLRYLEQQKWENGYSCRKCQHDKFHLAKNGFDRRCSRCGYVESPTAYTIFRGVKFPLEKAFYILHLVITERDDLTIDEISETLDLRRNTCWAFKDKVNKIIRKHHLDKGQAAHWENIIFKVEDIPV